MSQDIILDIMRDGLFTIIKAAAPPLLMGLVVGVLVTLFQTITSIQEQTLAFIPKILAVLFAIIIFGPFILSTLKEYTVNLMENITYYIVPR